MDANENEAAMRKLTERFKRRAKWIAAALQTHPVCDEWTALDFADLDDEETIEWMNEALLLVLHDRNDVRWETARGMRESLEQPPSWFTEEQQHVVLALLEAMLENRIREARLCAAYVLSVQGSAAAAAVPVLKRALSDRDDSIRYTAAAALGDIGPAAQSAVQKLVELQSRDMDRGVREIAAEALLQIRRRE